MANQKFFFFFLISIAHKNNVSKQVAKVGNLACSFHADGGINIQISCNLPCCDDTNYEYLSFQGGSDFSCLLPDAVMLCLIFCLG